MVRGVSAPSKARSKEEFFASPGGAPFFQKKEALAYFHCLAQPPMRDCAQEV
jgi:hypothetical protein